MKLPEEECLLLQSLNGLYIYNGRRNQRVFLLHQHGWTLQSIADAFEPPIPRSTVQYWASQPKDIPITPEPPLPTPPTKTPKPKYVPLKPKSPGIPKDVKEELAELAPLARQYRAKMSSTSQPALANQEFNNLIHELYNNNVKISEIAKASNVTNRAISRRLGK